MNSLKIRLDKNEPRPCAYIVYTGSELINPLRIDGERMSEWGTLNIFSSSLVYLVFLTLGNKLKFRLDKNEPRTCAYMIYMGSS